MADYSAILSRYLPRDSVEMVIGLLQEYKVHLKIARGRSSKLGDFRPPVNGGARRVSVNNDLNKFAFLITLIHEIAHVYVWINYRNRVKPHGNEWKMAYTELMMPFIEEQLFPDDIQKALLAYFRNPKASSVADRNLHKVLKAYDDKPTVFLEDIPENGYFVIKSGRIFRKMGKIRTRYRCMSYNDKKVYLVNALAEVKPYTMENE